MSEKVVLITGAAGGIGRTVADLFVKDGSKVVLVDISKENLVAVAQQLQLDPEKALLVSADVSNEDSVKYYVDQAISKFGRIDVFINNAGVEGKVQKIVDTTKENLDFVLGVNIKGVYFGLKYVLKHMMENKSGSIVNTSSVAGLMGTEGLGPYTASKHAVIGITKTAAIESAPFGIRVNAVCPGPVNNRMMRSIEDGVMPGSGDTVKKGFESIIPMARYAENDEIANTIYFLASDKASYITGGIYRVDGGMGAK
ncbi:MAG TPA: SDR family NAD(P)-dependent oxidoreductase [Bacilli bacterium]|nr:SDR family NAD(P)-dependent oxidoreductase [Bacilli bacterium]